MKKSLEYKKVRVVLAENVKKLRKSKNLSQEAFAAEVGLHRTYIGAVERGERNISIDNIARIAHTLGCNIEDLFKKKL